MHLLKTSKKYIENTANIFNKGSIIKEDNIISYEGSYICMIFIEIITFFKFVFLFYIFILFKNFI